MLVSEKVDLPNCHSIIAGNRQGMYDMVSHLIEAHGCKKDPFYARADKKLYAAKELRRPDVRREPEGASHQTV